MSKEKRLGRGLEALLGRVGTAEEGTPSQGPREIQQSTPASPPPAATLDELRRAAEDPSDEAEADSPDIVPFPYSDALSVQSETVVPPEMDFHESTDAPDTDTQRRIAVDRIDSNPYQPRREFDVTELESLSESLRDHGLLQPLVVRRQGDRFELIAGERRLRAAKQAGWQDVPVQVIDADDRSMAELAIVENMQRKDLNPMEKAASFQRYLQQYGSTQDELAGRLKIDRSTIANMIRLLELPEPVQQAVRQGKITQGHARSLLPLGEESEQIACCRRIEEEGLSVRRTEALVQETIESADTDRLAVIGIGGTGSQAGRRQSEHVASLEHKFRLALGAKVKLTHSSRGRGKLVIHFSSHEEFDRLLAHICGEEPHREAG